MLKTSGIANKIIINIRNMLYLILEEEESSKKDDIFMLKFIIKDQDREINDKRQFKESSI